MLADLSIYDHVAIGGDTMIKPELIVWLATLSEDDPRIEEVDAIRCGNRPTPPEEPLLSLKEAADALGLHYTSLHRLKAQNRIGPRSE